MVKLKPTVSVILDTRRANKDKLFPVKLRAIFSVSGKQVNKYYSLGSFASEADFNGARGQARTATQKELKSLIIQADAKALKVLESHDYVTVDLFERFYLGAGNFATVHGVFTSIIAELEKEDRVGSASVYRTAMNRVELYAGKELTFFEVSITWLKKFEAELRKEIGVTTTGIYMRHLRACYNRAIDMRMVNRDLYPFGRGGYVIRKGNGRKIALHEAQKDALLLISEPELQFALDFWKLSYYCFGLNMVDVALMKVGNIKDGVLIIGREKKKYTDKSSKQLVIPIRQEVKEIILRRGNKTLDPDAYVFPVLTPGLTAIQIKNRVHDFIRDVNEGLKEVAKKIEVDKLTTYTARHTFASIALRKGASKEFIQEALGHTSLATTEAYLSGFDVEAKRSMINQL